MLIHLLALASLNSAGVHSATNGHLGCYQNGVFEQDLAAKYRGDALNVHPLPKITKCQRSFLGFRVELEG